jgi:hypothetical protein
MILSPKVRVEFAEGDVPFPLLMLGAVAAKENDFGEFSFCSGSEENSGWR